MLSWFKPKHKGLTQISGEVFENLNYFTHRKKRKKFKIFLNTILICTLLLILILLSSFIYSYYKLKDYSDDLYEIHEEIALSARYLKENNFENSYFYSQDLARKLSKLENNINQLPAYYILGHSKKTKEINYKIKNYLDILKHLNNSLNRLSKSGIAFLEVVGNKNNFNQLTDTEKKVIFSLLYKQLPEMNGLRAQIDIIATSIENYFYILSLFPGRYEISQIIEELPKIQNHLNEIERFLEMTPVLFGYPQDSEIIYIWINKIKQEMINDSIKSAVLLNIKDNEILDVKDINTNNLDIQDSTSEWPAISRLLIEESIKQKDGENIAVIGFTTKTLKNILSIIGPLQIEKEIVNQENIEVLGAKIDFKDLITEIYSRLYQFNFNNSNLLSSALITELNEKDLLLYFNDAEIERSIIESGWGASITNTDSDYFSINTIQIGSGNINELNQSISYKLEQELNGVFARLRISYLYKSKTEPFNSKIKLIVPSGSKLIKVSTHNKISVPGDKIKIENQKGKYIIEAPFYVKPSDIGYIEFYYKLPDNIYSRIKSGFYDLLIQKQIGMDIELLDVDLRFKNRIKSYNPANLYADFNSNNIKWKTDLKTDKNFIIELNKY